MERRKTQWENLKIIRGKGLLRNKEEMGIVLYILSFRSAEPKQ